MLCKIKVFFLFPSAFFTRSSSFYTLTFYYSYKFGVLFTIFRSSMIHSYFWKNFHCHFSFLQFLVNCIFSCHIGEHWRKGLFWEIFCLDNDFRNLSPLLWSLLSEFYKYAIICFFKFWFDFVSSFSWNSNLILINWL